MRLAQLLSTDQQGQHNLYPRQRAWHEAYGSDVRPLLNRTLVTYLMMALLPQVFAIVSMAWCLTSKKQRKLRKKYEQEAGDKKQES